MKNEPGSASRRSALKKIAGTTAVAVIGSSLSNRISAAESKMESDLKGKVNHSVCRWCYNSIPLEDLCKAANEIGLTSIELTGPDEWPVLKKYGLTSAMPWGAGKGIVDGFNNLALHDELVKSYTEVIPKAAAAGLHRSFAFPVTVKDLTTKKV